MKEEIKNKCEKEKENEKLKDKINKEIEDLNRENDELKFKLVKEKENEELKKKFNNLNTQDQIWHENFSSIFNNLKYKKNFLSPINSL